MSSENIKMVGETQVKVTLEGTLEEVLRRLRLTKTESVALTALMFRDGKTDAHIENFIKIEMEKV